MSSRIALTEKGAFEIELKEILQAEMAALVERDNLNKCPPRQGNKSNRQGGKRVL